MPELSPLLYAYVAVAIFAAGAVRGAIGFGFSMIVIVLLSLVFPPALVVPVILFWEVLASIGHLPFVYKEVDWKALRWLMLGVLIGTPPGVYCMAVLPVETMRVAINASVVVLSVVLLVGIRLKKFPGPLQTAGVGVFSGFINGASANGGPPVILLFLSSPARLAVSRASFIAFFLFTDIWASLIYWHQGMITKQTFMLAGIFCLPLAAGIWAGSRWFAKVDEQRCKKAVLLFLIAIASVTLVRSIL